MPFLKSLLTKPVLVWLSLFLIVLVAYLVLDTIAPPALPRKAVSVREAVADSSLGRTDSVSVLSESDIDDLLKGFRANLDEFKSVTFYSDRASPVYVDRNFIYLYLGRAEKSIYPRLRIQYTGDDWVFVDRYHFVIDGRNESLNPSEQIIRDNEGGRVWEYLDQDVTADQLNLLSRISNSKVTKMRYEGKERVFDRVITDKEKKSLGRVLKILAKVDSSKI